MSARLDLSRPMIRYHGGKWLLAPWIISLMPSHHAYVEPFGGAASVLLRKPRSRYEVYNDLDKEVVNLFRVARDCGERLREAIELTPFARDEFIESYEPSDDAVEQARRTVVRAFMGRGTNATARRSTGFRSSRRGHGPSTADDWANYPSALDAIIDRLRGVVIENRHAFEVIESYDAPDALHYVDPPYVQATRDAGRDYRHELTEQEHIELAGLLTRVCGTVLLSGYRCPIYDDLYSGWTRIDRATHADGAKDRVESVWISRDAMQRSLL